jgi:formylglycine-generating enzyme required for sulfatase activity
LAALLLIAFVCGRSGAQEPKINPKDGAEMVYVPGGPFMMGDEAAVLLFNPPHRVTLSGYYIYKTPVTVAQFEKYCKATRKKMPDAPFCNRRWRKKNHPIVNVTWADAQAYSEWAGVRLPTEAEWEKAARGTDALKYPWGNTMDNSKLWCRTSKPGHAVGTGPVGSFPAGASPYGALDMEGNVQQWCADWSDDARADDPIPYDNYLRKSAFVNPTGPAKGSSRIVRGGSWGDSSEHPGWLHTAYRYFVSPGDRSSDRGFRCVSQD